MKHSSVSKEVFRKVSMKGEDTLWTYSDFGGLPEPAVAAALSRLAKKGVLNRIRKGVYYRPKITRFGETEPDAARVAEAVLHRRGICTKSSGLPAYNALGLTTQVSPVVTFDVDRRVNGVRVGVPGSFKIRTVGSVRNVSEKERAALDALRDLASLPDTSPFKAFSRIRDLCKSGELSIERVMNAAICEPPRVRALVGALAESLGFDAAHLARLRESLNGTTVYKLGFGDHLPGFRAWGIR